MQLRTMANQEEKIEMSATVDLQDYVERTSRLPDEALLGYVVLSTVSDLDIPHDDFMASLKRYGLDWAGPSSRPNDADIFRRVFTNGEHKTEHQWARDSAGTYKAVTQKLLIRTVKNQADRLVKRVVVETIDEVSETLMYSGTWEVVYSQGQVVSTQLEPSPEAATMIAAMEAKFHATRGTQDANAVRSTIRRVLDKCQAVNLTGSGRGAGSVYFVPKESIPLFHQLESAMALMDTKVPANGRSSHIRVHGFPLVDDKHQRDLVASAAKEDIEAEADALAREIGELLKEGKVSPRRFTSLFESVTNLQAKNATYLEHLEDAKLSTATRLSIVNAQMRELRQLMDKLADEKVAEKGRR